MNGDTDRSGYILVIDDDKDIRDIVATVLLDEGYEVASAASVERALELARERPPSLVLLDLSLLTRMPADFVASFRQEAEGTPPIIVMSGHAQIEQVAATLGADGVVEKPFDIVDLVETVRSTLDGHSAR